MARYLVRWTHEQPTTRYTMYETEIEAEDDADVEAVMRRLPRRTWGEWVDKWDEDGFGSPSDEYEVIEQLDKPEAVQGTPEDFGLKQASLL